MRPTSSSHGALSSSAGESMGAGEGKEALTLSVGSMGYRGWGGRRGGLIYKGRWGRHFEGVLECS